MTFGSEGMGGHRRWRRSGRAVRRTAL